VEPTSDSETLVLFLRRRLLWWLLRPYGSAWNRWLSLLLLLELQLSLLHFLE